MPDLRFALAPFRFALAPLMLQGLSFACSWSESSYRNDQTMLEVPEARLVRIRAVASTLSEAIQEGLDPNHGAFENAPDFVTEILAHCRLYSCRHLEFQPRYPAGKGAVVTPRLHFQEGSADLSSVFLGPEGMHWQIWDRLPSEIEAASSQLEIRAQVHLDPESESIAVDALIEVLPGGERFLVFDFLEALPVPSRERIKISGISQGGKPLRYLRNRKLLVVELEEVASATELRIRYSGTLPASGTTRLSASEFVLFEDWLPYLGGRANWTVELFLPRDYYLATPAVQTRALEGMKNQTVHLLQAKELDRYAIIGSRAPYSIENFEYLGTRFESWLRPEHAHRQAAVKAAVRKAMDAFEPIGPFPSSSYRILDATYHAGHSALGLRNMMVLGEGLLEEEYLLPTIAHELAHSWFAGLVGDRDGRWSEAVASYLSQWPLSVERARKMRWGWVVAYEQVPEHRDRALLAKAPLPEEDGLRSAIFYGKGALVLQELEDRIGPQKMRQIFSLFLYQYRGLSVGWVELQQSIADVMGNDEARRFGRWIESTGGPDWALTGLKRKGARLSAILEQRGRTPSKLELELGTLDSQGKVLSVQRVTVTRGQDTAIELRVPGNARWLAVDPNYTMPRRASGDGRPQWMVPLTPAAGPRLRIGARD